ncbi:MAG: hypothetical protein QM811_06965 [Pirellulales bacterium]
MNTLLAYLALLIAPWPTEPGNWRFVYMEAGIMQMTEPMAVSTLRDDRGDLCVIVWSVDDQLPMTMHRTAAGYASDGIPGYASGYIVRDGFWMKERE